MIRPELRRRQRCRRRAPTAILVALLGAACTAPTATPGATPGPGTIVTVVGSGVQGFAGIGGPKLETQLSTPVDLAFDGDGNLYIAERFGDRILVARPNGIVELVAGLIGEDGRPTGGYSGDGGPATKAQLDGVTSVAVDAAGSLYIADTLNNRIRNVDPAGVITTFAGTGEQGFAGDGGPAVEAQLHWPTGMAFDAEGNLFFADSGSFRIRRIDVAGRISTVAGTGRADLAQDGAMAVDSPLGHSEDHAPNGLAFDSRGRLHITDYGNFRIWRVDDDGRLRTMAGNGAFNSAGDGGPAIEAAISGPLDICFGPDGSLYIATHTHGDVGNTVRKVDPSGVITTVAGDGQLAYGGDGGPAVAASLSIPSSVALGPDGNLYIADAGNHRIRMVIFGKP